jgi:hypothetical protein
MPKPGSGNFAYGIEEALTRALRINPILDFESVLHIVVIPLKRAFPMGPIAGTAIPIYDPV